MLHIALITTSFPHGTPGSEAAGAFVYDFAKELSTQIKVSVIVPGKETSRESDDYFTINRYAVPLLPLSQLTIFKPVDWIAIYKTIRSGMALVDNLCKTEKYDYIFALWTLPSGYWANNVAKKYKLKYSVWALGSDIWEFHSKPLLRSILKKILSDADVCFADGYNLKKDVENISGRTCHFLPSARIINRSQKKVQRQVPPYRYAYLGRWHPNKGIDLLLESLGLLDQQDWNRIEEIRICGGGPLEAGVNQSVINLKSKSKPVVQVGYLSKEEAIELLIWADYLFIPSRIESIPVIFSDAMQCGTPVISMPVGDLPELIKGKNVGILATSVSTTAFAEAIRESLNKSPAHFGKEIENVAHIFNIKNIVNQFINTIFLNRT